MNTQFDYTARIVSLDNLTAMCARISGHSHTYTVSKVSRSRVHVEYSNPDEYGNPHPVTAVYPCFPSDNRTATGNGDTGNPSVVLDALCYLGDSDGYAYQAFYTLIDCPTLWRRVGFTNPTAEIWESHADILARMPGATSCGCVFCDVKGGTK